jgi:hypothetical protein
MYPRKTIILILLLVVKLSGYAQVLDSIKLALKTKPKVFAGLQNRNTFVNAQTIQLWGLVGGLDYDKKVKLYTGIYSFKSDKAILLKNNLEFSQDSVYRSLSTSNLGVGMEYIYYTKNRLSFSVPLQVGLGTLNHTYTAIGLHQRDKFFIIPLEFGVNSYLSILKYVRLKGGLGYRLIIAQSTAAKYSAPYYSLGLSVAVGQIYKDITK